MAATATRRDGGGGVGGGKNGVSGGSSTDRDNGDHDADGDHRRHPRVGYGASAGELIEFIGQNRPKGAMLSMDGDPLKFDSKRRFFGGHLEVDHQLPNGILPPRRAPVKNIHNGALKECLGLFYVAIDVLRGMVAQNSV